MRKQPAQYFGFLAHRAWPSKGMTRPPGPAKGAAHILHLGELGILLWIRRSTRNGEGLTSMLPHRSSAEDGGGISGLVIG